MRAVREALGPRAQIRVDANAAWDLETASEVLAEIEPLGIQLAEQPVATMERAAELAARPRSRSPATRASRLPSDALRAARTGAFRADRDQALEGRRARRRRCGSRATCPPTPRAPSTARSGSRSALAWPRSCAPLPWPARGERSHGLATQRLFASTIASVECELRDGMLHPPPGPGLGVEIDEDGAPSPPPLA